MKILTFSTLYPNAARPTHGIFVETRLRQLRANVPIECKVIAPVPWFPFDHVRFGDYAAHARAPREEVRSGIEVLHPRYLVLPKIGMTIAPLLLSRAVAPVLERVRERFDFDLIDAHYFYPDGVAAVMLGKRVGKPVVVTARGSDINLIAQYRLPRRMICWAAEHAAGVASVSEALKGALAALGVPREKVRVLRNGVDLKLFTPVERAAVRRRLGMRRTTLLSVGNLLASKGHDLVIRALARLPECDLVVIGAGPERAALGALAASCGLGERVRFAGPFPQEELRDYYGATDLLVLASSREGWPNVLLEAMACGTPVLATDVGGCREVVTAPEAGLLSSRRSPDALADGVRQLLANYPDRAATRRYAERFGWEATSSGQFELFQRVVAGGGCSCGAEPAA
jgi:glycosyltransferase involved in cell wall biosynthesis